MKHPPLCVALGLLLSCLPTLTSASTPPSSTAMFRNLEAGKTQTVVVYGTSLTHGGQWTVATKKWFDEQYPGKVKFINSGGPGQNSDWGLKNLKSKVLDLHPDLVFVEFSYNDAHEKFKMPVERGASNLARIVEGIRAQNPGTVIVLQIMNVGWDAPNGNRSLSVRPDLEQYNDNYRKFAREQGLPLLDHSVEWKKLKATDLGKFKWYIPDGTHPSPEGSLAVTWPTVKTWLETARASAK
ncbi:MAG: SGNH/GDSL hydrolase family protein [Opitutaceae bacterium]